MEDPRPTPPDDDELSTGRKIFGFSWSFLASIALTVAAVPLLFNAVCMPVNPNGTHGYFNTDWIRPDWVFGLYIIGGVAGAIVVFRRTANPGVRWGCITTVLLLTGAVLYSCVR
jgi:hypothetical protein